MEISKMGLTNAKITWKLVSGNVVYMLRQFRRESQGILSHKSYQIHDLNARR